MIKPESVDNVQLDSTRIVHENDTEDIATDVDPNTFNKHHSKKWNAQVDKEALAIENQIKIEENTRISEERAVQQAAQKVVEEKAEKLRLA